MGRPDLSELYKMHGDRAVSNLEFIDLSREPTGNPFPVTYLNDRAPCPTAYVIDRVLPEESCAMISAPQKSGKTWVTFSIALCVAHGLPFFGFPVRRTGRVLLYTPESGLEAKRRRLWGLAWGLGLDPRDALAGIALISGRMNLTAADHIARLADTVAAVNPLITVIDPFVAAAAGIDENSAGVVQPVLDALRDTCAVDGRSLILCHHCNKGQGQNLANAVRGTSAIGGWWDTHLTIRRESEDQADCVRRVDVEHRDDGPPAPWGFEIVAAAHREAPEGVTAFRLDPREAPEKGKGSYQKSEFGKSRQEVMAHIAACPGQRVADLAKQMNMPERTMRNYVSSLDDDGKVRRDGWHVYPC